jgi:hypothetical protein
MIETITPGPHNLSLIRLWWEQRRHYAPPPEILSPYAILARETSPTDGSSQSLAAGFLYPCQDTPVAHIHWLVSNPMAGAHDRARALRAVVTALEALASDMGHPFIFTATDNTQLAELGTRHAGYTVASLQPFIPLFKYLDPNFSPECNMPLL